VIAGSEIGDSLRDHFGTQAGNPSKTRGSRRDVGLLSPSRHIYN